MHVRHRAVSFIVYKSKDNYLNHNKIKVLAFKSKRIMLVLDFNRN
jgi:hypothetical protein